MRIMKYTAPVMSIKQNKAYKTAFYLFITDNGLQLYIQIIFSKMASSLKVSTICLLSAIIFSVTCLPTLYSQYTINITDPMTRVLAPEISTYQGRQLLFIATLAGDNVTYFIYNYNITGGIIAPITSKNINFTDMVVFSSMSLVKQHILLSFKYIWGGDKQISLGQYSLLSSRLAFTAGDVMLGNYLWNFDLFVYSATTEGIYQDIQWSNGTIQSTYATNNTFPYYVKQLISRDQSRQITVNKINSNIYSRSLTSSSQIITDFNTPLITTLGFTDYQCACLSSDGSTLYVLSTQGWIIKFNTSTNVKFGNLSTPYMNIKDCYYDSTTLNLILLQSTGSGTDIKQIETATGGTVNMTTIPTWYQSNNPHPVYFFAINYNVVSIYSKGPVDQLYYDNFVLSTGNSSNITNATSNATGPTNTTSNATGPVYITFRIVYIEVVLYMLSNPVLTTVNKIPASRKALPFLCFLVSLDQLQLYQYHQRNYGQTMNKFFDQLQIMENQKWELIGENNIQKVYSYVGTSQDEVYQFIDTKINYTSPTFRKAEGRGETLLSACWEFLTFNFIFVLVGFFLLRWGFNMLFNYPISIFLRAFSSLVFLAPLLFEGNLHYFFFLLFSQMSLGFSLTPKDKIFNVISYFLYFIIIWFSVVSSFMAYYLNKKLAKYIIGNWRSRVEGLLAYSICNTIRMMIFGAIHSLLRNHSIQLPILLVCQTLFLVFLFYSLTMKTFYRINFKIWFTIIFVMVRICLQIMLIIQQKYNYVGSETIYEDLFQNIIGFLLLIYVFTFYLGTLWEFVYEIIELLKPANSKKMNNIKQDKSKKNKNNKVQQNKNKKSQQNKDKKSQQNKNKKSLKKYQIRKDFQKLIKKEKQGEELIKKEKQVKKLIKKEKELQELIKERQTVQPRKGIKKQIQQEELINSSQKIIIFNIKKTLYNSKKLISQKRKYIKQINIRQQKDLKIQQNEPFFKTSQILKQIHKNKKYLPK